MTPLILDLPYEADTTHLGQALARVLGAGDCVLLEGSIGAGKSHLARALIRALRDPDEEVPSPTFTLVQTYPGNPDIWHADLYRLTHPDEVHELGLEAAFGDAICLIEWPDRLGAYTPENPIRLRLDAKGDGRVAQISVGARPDSFSAALLAHLRALKADAFLTQAGWGDARREALAQDASTRSYARLWGEATAIFMDAPPGQADSVADFVKVDQHLLALGLSAPKILAQDIAQGFLLLEDLGDGLYPAVIAADPALEPSLYEAATDVLLLLQAHPAAADLPDLSAQEWADAAGLVADWYVLAITGQAQGRAKIVAALAQALTQLADGPRVMILRDYHVENLLHLPERAGLARVGVLDFQLAQMGQAGYDLVSLLQDARRDVPAQIEAAMIARFAKARGLDLAAFQASYAALGTLRALRILGIFARLCLVGGKPKYLALIPRVWGQLQRNLSHPALADLRAACDRFLPAPTDETLQRIRSQCSPSP
jgi:tRNA threonylcarbamoyl adenosine modification protein YjeE